MRWQDKKNAPRPKRAVGLNEAMIALQSESDKKEGLMITLGPL
jgi:hypothetical protein